MADHIVTVSWTTKDQNFPNGTIPGNYNVAITGGAANTVVAPMVVAASPAVFSAVPAEAQTDPDYTATVMLIDGDGNALGTPMSATFSVVEPPVVGQVPDVVTVSVS